MIDTSFYTDATARADAVLDEVDQLREEREIDPPEDEFPDVSGRYTRSALGGRKPSVDDLLQQQRRQARQHSLGGGIAAVIGGVAGSLGSLLTQEYAYQQQRELEAEFLSGADGTSDMMLRMRVARLESRVEELESKLESTAN
jgi:hypothetical protein